MVTTCPTTEAALQAGLLPAQERRKGHFAKVAGRLKKSFRRPACHAYDYAALIVPTAVCICIGMHAVKRRNRTHEIHNLHKTHRPEIFAKPDICRTRVGGCPVQSSALLVSYFSGNDKLSIKSNI